MKLTGKTIDKINCVIFFVLAINSSFIFAQEKNATTKISDVKIKKNWIVVLDSLGKEISKMKKSNNTIVGFADHFFVVTTNDLIITYNEKCKEIARMSSEDVLITDVKGDSFTVLKNNETIIYDKNCRKKLFKQGQFYFRISFPYIDILGFNNGRNFYKKNAFFGLTGGVDYYYSDRSYISFYGGGTGIGNAWAQDNITDTVGFATSSSAKLTNNHDFYPFPDDRTNLSLGYGLSYSSFYYEQTYQLAMNSKEIILYNGRFSKLGLAFDANVYFRNHVYTGLSILPSFYTLNTGKFELSYIIYSEIGYRFQFRKKQKKKNKANKSVPRFL